MPDELYKEEMECWVANQSWLTLFAFWLGLIAILLSIPPMHIYYWLKWRVVYKLRHRD